jgi:hypothetical protein
MRKLSPALFTIIVGLMLSNTAFAGKVQLTKDTQLKVKFDSPKRISSGSLQKGEDVAIYLAEDFKIGGETIIEAGAKGTAKVKEVVKASRPGKPGKIAISFVSLGSKGAYKAAGGKEIKLTGSIGDDGGGRKILSWLFILGLFIKGGQGQIDTALEYPATVAETIILESK